MNSAQLKTAILCHYRYRQRRKYIATEVGTFSADVIVANDKDMHEIEVKTSISDFRNDFKKEKHNIYCRLGSRYSIWIPNKFYFAVTPALKDFALKYLQNYPQYGLYVVNTHIFLKEGKIEIAKPARYIHRNPVSPKIYELLLFRMSSEIAIHYLKNELTNKVYTKLTKIINLHVDKELQIESDSKIFR